MKKSPVSFVLSFIAAALLMLPSTLLAQNTTPPLSEMWIMVPKAGHGKEFVEGLKKHMAYRTEQGDSREWGTYTPLLGDDLNRFAVRYCCFNWADVDTYRAWGRENSQVSDHFEDYVGPHVEKFEHYFESTDWANSHWSDKNDDARFFAVTEFRIKPGHGSDFDAARDKMSQIAINQGWATDERSWIWNRTIGGKPLESIVIPHANFASMAREEKSFSRFLATHMGEGPAADLMKRFSAAAYSDFQIWEYREELSMESSE